jgi:hypothetical protein
MSAGTFSYLATTITTPVDTGDVSMTPAANASDGNDSTEASHTFLASETGFASISFARNTDSPPELASGSVIITGVEFGIDLSLVGGTWNIVISKLSPDRETLFSGLPAYTDGKYRFFFSTYSILGPTVEFRFQQITAPSPASSGIGIRDMRFLGYIRGATETIDG